LSQPPHFGESRVAAFGPGVLGTVVPVGLRQACAVVASRFGHRIGIDADEIRLVSCDGVLLLDGADGPGSPLPTLAIDTSAEVEEIVRALQAWSPQLWIVQARRNARLSAARRELAASVLMPREWRDFERAKATRGWSSAEAEVIIARGSRQAQEDLDELTTAGIRNRAPRNLGGWLAVEQELCDEHGE